jgi:thiamine biosynthesis lipoprotein
LEETSVTVEERPGGVLAATFSAMASPCELLLSGTDRAEAWELGMIIAREAWRIERKYSRYRDDSVVASIHRHRGRQVEIDAETSSLLDFAKQCYELSDGMFDITSGILRRAWKFDGSDRVPEPNTVKRLLQHVGFDKVQWRCPHLTLPAEMEIDFGGLGKEYAVDRAFDLLSKQRSGPFLLNFGGDLRANQPPAQAPWQVGVERPGTYKAAEMVLELTRGSLATSGDSRRFLLKNGVRYGHVLDPYTGWPVTYAPRSVTVAASSCTEAGLLSTLALLHGAQAEAFLDMQGVRYWILR